METRIVERTPVFVKVLELMTALRDFYNILDMEGIHMRPQALT